MSSEYKRFYRSPNDRMIAGVCGGLAMYFSLDPTLVRLGFVGAAFIDPAGAVLAYLVMKIVVPDAPLADASEG